MAPSFTFNKLKRPHYPGDRVHDATVGGPGNHLQGALRPDPEMRPTKRVKAQGSQHRDLPASLPSISGYLPIVLGGSRWHARRSLQNIVVFGDSYSKPTEGKTWVDYLQRCGQTHPSELYNFSFSGATAEDDLSDQLSRFFKRFPGKADNGDRTPALDPDKTTFFVFLGINDCGATDCDDLEAIVETIFDALHRLYVKAGARNFVLLDVPPIDRTPQAVASESEEEIKDRVKTWNALLQAQTTEFGLSSNEATAILFSTHQALTEVLEDPVEYEFSAEDPTDEGGCIWADDLHLTSEVHDILGERLLTSVLGSRS